MYETKISWQKENKEHTKANQFAILQEPQEYSGRETVTSIKISCVICETKLPGRKKTKNAQRPTNLPSYGKLGTQDVKHKMQDNE